MHHARRTPRRLVGLAAAILGCMALAACSETTSNTSGSGGAGATVAGAGGGGGQGGGGASSSAATASTGIGGSFGSGGFAATPVRELEGLESITFYERTGGTEPTAYTFVVNGSELTTRLADPLSSTNKDITGTSIEFYDVYYSDIDGEFDIDGSYLTISGVFPSDTAGGGLNLAEIGLNYVDAPVEFGNYLASYVVLGNNGNEATVGACIDGDLQTHTTMGNTVNSSERLRLTLGFESTSGIPE